ncbi:MAG: hypothetical protein FWF49_01230 [Oscillospiraceae bacterium]|nr:hypothetical protein [Oscillospiraceae bacterium]
MNEGQQRFYDFALQRVQAGKEGELKALLDESFARQAQGTFTPEYMTGLMPRMTALIRPECVPELLQAAAHMRGQIG